MRHRTGSQLRTHVLPLMLDRKYVAVELRYPLPSFHCQFEMVYGVVYVGFHLTPKEPGVSLGHVGGISITQLLIYPDLSELMEECIELARIQRISELSNKVGSAQQAGLRVGFRVVPIVGYGKASQLDRSRNSLAIDERMRSEALQYYDL